jgi:hypothetical protein
MQSEATSSESINIEMSLRNFRTMHEPRPSGVQAEATSGFSGPKLNLPQLPHVYQATLKTAAPELPIASRSRERRSNTVISQVQGAFKVKAEDMMSGGIDKAKFKCFIDQHLKKQTG